MAHREQQGRVRDRGPSAAHRAVMWFRRDLRLSDNPALAAALASSHDVIPLFVWDPILVGTAGAPRLAFLCGCLRALDRSLGGALVVRLGDPVEVVPAVAAHAAATVVFCAADFGPYGTKRDEAVAGALAAQGRRMERVGSPYAVPPGTLQNSTGQPFRVFSPFHRAWTAAGWSSARPSSRVSGVSRGGLSSDRIPDGPAVRAALPPPGEEAGQQRLDAFLAHGVDRYGTERDRPDRDGTSRLSPYLKFGCLHPRQVLDGLRPGQRDHDRFAAELCWREFYADVLFNHPDSARQAYRPEWRQFEVDSGGGTDERFAAWTEGRTGYPIVDAGMRQLGAEAWMHNRVRMITASFLIKDLHLDWTVGARWFMQQLVDGDLASNQHGWQWVAGSGTDAAPFFRIFNPVVQGRKFDPDGRYIRRWVPELSGVAAPEIHEPSSSATLTTGLFGANASYPAPIVDHASERQEALARYERLRRRR